MDRREIAVVNQIGLALRGTAVCVWISEAFSVEAGAVHFRDIASGVWSGPPVRFNPFTNAAHAQLLRRWFNWRLALLQKVRDATSYRTLRWLQSQGAMTFATACVDHLADTSGLTNVLYLSGRVAERRCVVCGLSLGADSSPEAMTRCPECGGAAWPDVSMFGQNTHAEASTLWQERLEQATLLVQIGESYLSTPMVGGRATLDVLANGLNWQTPESRAFLEIGSLEALLDKHAGGTPWPEGLAAKSPAGGIHRTLISLCRVLASAPFDER
ncbi:hypothetical protein OPU71_17030 [Niveibacterium sp. 24ML]|uniref:Sir2 family NAD-dependent protein deacetylase n=1 Tax=Niveibacterium sp. 24ML TaxID=2985512 RepID=UPI002271BE1F|nr:Sir2 family NAD-dependent protein deacetylase [Niveibacterium sp. 24ML]MCX9157830.1 hypothetical protein [Niveibacterium sp. 24ML]